MNYAILEGTIKDLSMNRKELYLMSFGTEFSIRVGDENLTRLHNETIGTKIKVKCELYMSTSGRLLLNLREYECIK